MNILLLGAAGFIGTNLTGKLAENRKNSITLVDRELSYFAPIRERGYTNVSFVADPLEVSSDLERLVAGQDEVYHLMCTTVPATSNQQISQELTANVVFSANLLDACVKCGVGKVVFFSSGGTVYGKEAVCPIAEDTPANPINSYGFQKITIEKLLYLYWCMYGLDYRIIRLANPYGPYQRPNGILGAVTTFTYQALRGEEIQVYGDGSVVRDFIYIEDAVRAILRIVDGTAPYRTYNVGCGYGTSLRQLLEAIQDALGISLRVAYSKGRAVDVPVNYLDISRYEACYGPLSPIGLRDGILKTAAFMREHYL